jgi:hypothetical protein
VIAMIRKEGQGEGGGGGGGGRRSRVGKEVTKPEAVKKLQPLHDHKRPSDTHHLIITPKPRPFIEPRSNPSPSHAPSTMLLWQHSLQSKWFYSHKYQRL